MKRKLNVIKINGFKGILLAIFIVGCVAAGFMIFPGWVCMNIWNFVAKYFTAMPVMTLLHGSMLWIILALSTYALNKGKLAISFGSAPMPAYREYNDARIKHILEQINEKNASIVHSEPSNESMQEQKDETETVNKE